MADELQGPPTSNAQCSLAATVEDDARTRDVVWSSHATSSEDLASANPACIFALVPGMSSLFQIDVRLLVARPRGGPAVQPLNGT